ncbi:class I SAM-dependent methyltransferase [Leucobacter chinensis]|uniref:class I SAM-dependent methyltransferase n=1 Tax=Leucobacter chinensis TaxID=2851010 RepID=UPI001C24558A|nr:class I SAM-dependent methyltransferase [Leucobacter chinensis]
MTDFDRDFWQRHWAERETRGVPTPHPYLATETAQLAPGTVLDAGCGAGAEALWLARQGWSVTAADISASALDEAKRHERAAGTTTPIEWIEADLSRWNPDRTWSLVVTSYAHAEIGQLALYERLASWVAPGGTLLIVGHAASEHQEAGHAAHEHVGESLHAAHPHEATVTREAIAGLFTAADWSIETSTEHTRTAHPGGASVELRDVVVRARRLGGE